MLASLLCNFPFVPGPRKIRWRNKYGEFDTYEEAIAVFRTRNEIPIPPMMVDAPAVSRRPDDEALVFILAHV